jgi:hypothetical protein
MFENNSILATYILLTIFKEMLYTMHYILLTLTILCAPLSDMICFVCFTGSARHTCTLSAWRGAGEPMSVLGVDDGAELQRCCEACGSRAGRFTDSAGCLWCLSTMAIRVRSEFKFSQDC